MKHPIAIAIALLCGAPLLAQLPSDALRYSYLQPSGTARFVGAGGAFSAIGADFGVLSTNPAGLAWFRSSEVVLTPGIKFTHTETGLPGAGNYAWDDDKSNFKFDNVGVVFHTTPKSKAWKTFNVGIGFNRQASFQQSVYYQGIANGTILNDFYGEVDQVVNNNGGSIDDLYPFGARLAVDADAIYDIDEDGVYDYDFGANPDAAIQRTHALSTRGSLNEMVLSMAGNYDEKLMVGFTVGVPFVNYTLEGEYTETDVNAQVDSFETLSYTEYLRTEGVGVNFKLGIIYRVNSMLRLGAAVHSPTLLGLTDTYNNSFSYEYSAFGGRYTDEADSPEGTTDYRLRTPWRANASAAFIFQKYGFLSADVELVDYSAATFNFTADIPSSDNQEAEREVNRAIQTAYQQAVNLRLGGELALENFRFRAGVNLLGNPVEGESGFRTAYTAGAGVRSKAFFLDLGYRLTLGDGSVSAPYSGAPVASLDSRNNEILLSIGFKF
jgi:hypothetical protein